MWIALNGHEGWYLCRQINNRRDAAQMTQRWSDSITEITGLDVVTRCSEVHCHFTQALSRGGVFDPGYFTITNKR